jgi:hypothetical protein
MKIRVEIFNFGLSARYFMPLKLLCFGPRHALGTGKQYGFYVFPKTASIYSRPETVRRGLKRDAPISSTVLPGALPITGFAVPLRALFTPPLPVTFWPKGLAA